MQKVEILKEIVDIVVAKRASPLILLSASKNATEVQQTPDLPLQISLHRVLRTQVQNSVFAGCFPVAWRL